MQANKQDNENSKISHGAGSANDDTSNPSLTRVDICQTCVSWADINDSLSRKQSTLYELYKEL